MTYNIAILGQRASGKTNFIRLLHDCRVEKRYFSTIGTEVHPSNHDGKNLNLWEFGRYSDVSNINNFDGVIFMTRRKDESIPQLQIPIQVVVMKDMNPKSDLSELLKKI